MVGQQSEFTEKDMEILEARYIFLLMKRDYRISRSIRMQWFLEHLNKTVTVPHITELSKGGAELQSVPKSELKVISVVPHEQPPEWKPESSHTYKYLVTAHSNILFLTHNYCIVYCLDMSPSLSAVVSIFKVGTMYNMKLNFLSNV
ncbi:hypothetical protein C0J52_13199 [Blattella germanica]|nr:hypothetical protein C0J52_13199 [Blattella germanica]